MSMRTRIKALESPVVFRWRRRSNRSRNIVLEHLRDMVRYRRYSSPDDSEWDSRWSGSPSHLVSQVVKDYHRIEKGLALEAPKRPFGEQLLKRMAITTALADSQVAQLDVASVRSDAESAIDAILKLAQNKFNIKY